MEKFRPDYEKRGPNNVAIDINRFVVKYDFDIARKLKHEVKDRDSDEEDKKMMSTDEIIRTFKTNAILEILQTCSNELAKEGEYYQSIWTLDGQQISDLDKVDPECKILLVSHLPMAAATSNVNLKPRSRKNNVMTQDSLNVSSEAVKTNVQGLIGNAFAVNNW